MAPTRKIEQATGLSCVLQTPGFILFSDGNHVLFAGGRALIIGHIFSREDRPKAITTANAHQYQILKADGTFQSQAFWGGYVAMTLDAPSADLLVSRDPSAALPCYYMQTDHGLVFSSDMDTLVDSGVLTPMLDWNYLAHHLYANDLRSTRTALKGVVELLAGFTMAARGQYIEISPYWSPWDHASPITAMPAADNAEQLYKVVTGCIQAWADRFTHPLLSLSGGLDSSIVAAALAQSSVKVTCMTFATEDANGDERQYARAVADQLNLPMAEAFYQVADIDFGESVSAHLPRPAGFAFAQSNLKLRSEFAAANGVDAFWSGVGGDNVFCYLKSASPLLDRLAVEGISGGTWTTAIDICALTNCSYFDLLKLAFVQSASGPKYSWKSDARFLNVEAFSKDTFALTHPWLEDGQDQLHGKAAHVASILRLQATIEGDRRDMPPQILPLLSQPILETCLSIPSWQWCMGGRNRAVVRDAFAGRLPSIIINRRTKGGPGTFAYQALYANRTTVREMLLGGLLASNGLLDIEALVKTLSPDRDIHASEYLRLSSLCEAEAWAQTWTRRKPRVAMDVH